MEPAPHFAMVSTSRAESESSLSITSASSAASATSPNAWRKVLYLRQDVPDNYVHESFLSDLRKNVTVPLFTYNWLLRHSVIVTQQLICLVMFVTVFTFLYNEMLSASDLLIVANTLTFIGYLSWLLYCYRQGPNYSKVGRQVAKSGALFMLVLMGLTPILKTLTEDWSSDTIWALTAAFLFINAAFFDYAATDVRGDDSIALNAVIFASVLLASRLPTQIHVFGLLSLAVNWFALFPIVRRSLRSRSKSFDVPMTIVLFLSATMLTGILDIFVSVIFVLSFLGMTFVLPALYVHMQKYKNEVHGPWNEATVQLKRPKRQ